MANRKPDFIRSLDFHLSFGHPKGSDVAADGRWQFRERLFDLLDLVAEYIAENESKFIGPGKKVEDESGFPFTIELGIVQSKWDYQITAEVNSGCEDEDTVGEE